MAFCIDVGFGGVYRHFCVCDFRNDFLCDTSALIFVVPCKNVELRDILQKRWFLGQFNKILLQHSLQRRWFLRHLEEALILRRLIRRLLLVVPPPRKYIACQQIFSGTLQKKTLVFAAPHKHLVLRRLAKMLIFVAPRRNVGTGAACGALRDVDSCGILVGR